MKTSGVRGGGQGGSGPAVAAASTRGWASSRRLRLVTAAVVLGISGGLASSIDIPVARWCKATPPSGDLARLLNFSEVFAHALGVGVLLVAVFVLDRSWNRSSALRFVAATFAGGLIVDVIKAVVVRVRPRAADLATVASAADTFSLAALAGPAGSHSDRMSFPSGHAAVAAGFAAALAWRYPRGALFFTVVAAMAAAQRLVCSAHYPSDIACGAAIGLLGAALFLGDGRADSAMMDSPGRA